MAFEKEFKEAISNLPDKEKDKLILRLLRHDKILSAQLHFDLISTQTQEELRGEMETAIKTRVAQISSTHYSIGYLLMHIRSLSGEISTHVKITRDKFGEVSLNLLMLNQILERNASRIQKSFHRKTDNLTLYIIVRTFKILVLIRSMHEDLHIDFREGMETLGDYISSNERLKRMAARHGLDLNWLTPGELPEDIKQIQENLKRKGLLK